MNNWTSQIRKGLVELVVLAALNQGEAYGYELLQLINQTSRLDLTESTVYPLLARLSRDKLVRVRVAPSPHGPPRRYYQLTAAGRQQLTLMKTHWHTLNENLRPLLGD